ncbi:peroxidase family protein [Limnohabitans sp.]
MLLNQTDIDFILAQLTLPGNDPRRALNGLGTVLDPSGIRDVGGVGNNVNNPAWGAVDQAFARLTAAGWTNAQGILTGNQFGVSFGTTPTSYQVRDVNLWDSTPRTISNLVSNQSPEALKALGYVDPAEQRLLVLDDPTSTPGGRVSPLTGNMNPLPYSGFMTMFGQFFDHGLDFVHKGADGDVMVPLLKGDELFRENIRINLTDNGAAITATSSTEGLLEALGLDKLTQLTGPNVGTWRGLDASDAKFQTANLTGTFTITVGATAVDITVVADDTFETVRAKIATALDTAASAVTLVEAPTNFMAASRTNTIHVQIGEESTDALLTALGLTQTVNGEPGSVTALIGATLGNTITFNNGANTNTGAGVLMINHTAIDIASGSNRAAVVAAINAKASTTGVVAYLTPTNQLVLTPPTVKINVGTTSTDALTTELGLAETASLGGVVTSTTAVAANIVNAGSLVINGQSIDIAAGATPQQLVNAINAQVGTVGITASLDGSNRLVLTPVYLQESINTVSPFIDLSQSYGSDPSKTAFVREYDINGVATGRLVSGNGDVGADGMSTWKAIKVNAARLGIILHDVNVTDTPMVRLNADGSTYEGTGVQNGGWLVARHVVTGAIYYIKDSYMADNGQGEILNANGTVATANDALRNDLRLQTVGHAFLDDMAHGVLDATLLNAKGDLTDPTLLNAHFVAGDGRANENVGLTAIHDIFHSEHNRVLKDIQALVLGGIDSAGVTHTARADAGSWTGEMFFQAAKLVTEMEYQHLVFGEFARKLSPNVNAFAGYDVTIDPAVMAEFAHAVYRFGHSMLTETVDMRAFNAVTGLAIAGDAGDKSMGLIEAFLNPMAYSSTTAGEVALGMGAQVGNAIDEWVTDALRNNLVGLPLDLATLNMVRGRDTGMASLNAVRADLFAQTGDVNLKPYDNWLDFGMHLTHQESLINFIMAYARDALITEFGVTAGLTTNIGDWDTLQATDPSAYSDKLRLAAVAALSERMGPDAFLMGNAGLNNVDFWLGGLAESKVAGGMLGSTFDFIFAMQMISLQNSDRFYYLGRLAGTDLLLNIEGQLFSDIVARNTGVNHLYTDIFTVADSYVEIAGNDAVQQPIDFLKTPNAIDALGNDVHIGHAGWIGDTFYGNTGEYLDSRGVFSPNLKGNASEMLGGTSSADKINAFGGNDTVWGDDGKDTIEGGAGNDFLHGGLEGDTITDTEGDDLIWGDEGNDNIQAGNGIDQVFGDEGNDTVYGGLGADIMDGGAGDDVIYGDNGAITTRVFNGVTINVMDANGDADLISGGDGNDLIYGGGGADGIDGGEGDDTIYGGLGADALVGWYGNDTFVMDADDIGFGNVIDGGTDIDTVDYSLSVGNGVGTGVNRQGVNVDLSNVGPAVVPGAALAPQVADSFLSVERAIGSAYNDTLTGGASVLNNLGLQTDQFGLPILVGGNPVPIDFYIDGGAGADLIAGGDGDDTLVGGLGIDTLTGGLGDDVYVMDSNTEFLVELAGEGLDTVQTTAILFDLNRGNGINDRSGIEYLTYTGTSGFDGRGNALNNVITGGIGNDTLSGGAGIDTLVGGAGNDTYTVDTVTDLITELAAGGTDLVNATLAAGLTFTLGAEVENLTLLGNAASNGTGNTVANLITGNTGANVLTSVANTLSGTFDTLVGGTGNDTYVVDHAGVVITEATGAGTDTVSTSVLSAFTLSAANVENLIYTGVGNFAGTGSSTANIITGGTGNDSLDGAEGNDTLIGGAGNDTLIGGTGVDSMTGGLGNDTFVFVAGSSGTATNRDRIADFLVGTDKIDLSSFGALQFIGSGNFTTAGQVRVTTAGNVTTVEVNTAGANGSELSVDLTGALALTAADFSSNVTVAPPTPPVTPSGPPVVPNGPAAALNQTGTNAANTMTGDTGNDTLSGGRGNDTIDGGAGNDVLNGGRDTDVITGGLGNDVLTGGTGADAFIFNSVLNGTTNVDNITDFTAVDDTIRLENAIFTALTATGVLNTNFLRLGTAAVDNNDFIIYDANSGNLWYDADANGVGAQVLFATLANQETLTRNDFVVI